MAQLRAGKKLHVHLEAFDSRGNSVPDDPATTSDNIGWTLADGGDAVIGLTVDDDSRGATLRWVGLGSTVLTAAIPTSRGNREVTLALDAIPGEINSLEITVGDEEDDDGSAPV